jgi:hypothetical protein
MVVLMPILLLVSKRPSNFLLNIFKVLLGEKTWVGYTPAANESMLPKLKPAVLTTIHPLREEQLNPAAIQKVNFLYAKEYAPEKDLKIIFSSLRQLGE